jgi:hypothetical protein
MMEYPVSRARLRTLLVQWRESAAQADRDGDFCCAVTREHDADDLEAALRVCVTLCPAGQHLVDVGEPCVTCGSTGEDG